MKRLAFLAPLAFLLAACAPESGTVIEKGYEPERQYWENVQTGQNCTTSSSGVRTCTPNYTMMPKTDDEDWWIKIEDCTSSTDCDRGTVYVTESEYNSLKPGDYFTRKKEN